MREKSRIRIHIPEEFVGFSIQELVSAGGVVDSIISLAPGRQTVEGALPVESYDSVVQRIAEYVGGGQATFERSDPTG